MRIVVLYAGHVIIQDPHTYSMGPPLHPTLPRRSQAHVLGTAPCANTRIPGVSGLEFAIPAFPCSVRTKEETWPLVQVVVHIAN